MCDWSADGNYVQAFSEEQRRSRKARKCSTCGGRIKEGERYVRFFWVHDGDACSSSQCLFCNVAYEAFRSEHREYPMPNELWSGLIECLDGVNKRQPEAVAWRNALAGMKRRERVASRVPRDGAASLHSKRPSMTDLCVCGHPKDSHCFCISTCNGLGVCGRCRYGPSRGPHVRCLEFRPAPQPHPEPEGVESRQAMCDEVKREVFHVSYLPASSESVDNAIRNLMQMVGDAKTRAMTAEAKVEKLKEALACAEWATEHAECPWCGGNKHDGHKPGCAIAEALE